MKAYLKASSNSYLKNQELQYCFIIPFEQGLATEIPLFLTLPSITSSAMGGT